MGTGKSGIGSINRRKRSLFRQIAFSLEDIFLFLSTVPFSPHSDWLWLIDDLQTVAIIRGSLWRDGRLRLWREPRPLLLQSGSRQWHLFGNVGENNLGKKARKEIKKLICLARDDRLGMCQAIAFFGAQTPLRKRKGWSRKARLQLFASPYGYQKQNKFHKTRKILQMCLIYLYAYRSWHIAFLLQNLHNL